MPARSPSARHRKKPDPLAARIGARIKALRGEMDFTFDAFVEETSLGRGYVSELERGLVVPSVTTLERVAQALEVTMADLLLGTSTREQLFAVTRDLPAKSVDELLSRARQLAAK